MDKLVKYSVKRFIILTILSCAVAFFEFIAINLFSSILIEKENQVLKKFIQALDHIINIESDYTELVLILLVSISALRLLSLFIYIIYQTQFINNLLTEIRFLICKFILYTQDENITEGEISNLITKESERVTESISYVVEFIKKFFQFAAYFVAAMLISIQVVIAVFAIAPIFLAAMRFTSSYIPTYSRMQLERSEIINTFTIDFSRTIDELRIKKYSFSFLDKYKSILTNYQYAKFKLDLTGKLFKSFPDAVGMLFVAVILLIMTKYTHVSLAEVIVTAGVMYRAFTLLMSLQYLVIKIVSLKAPIEKVVAKIDSVSEYHYPLETAFKNIKLSCSSFNIGKTKLTNLNLDFKKGNIYLIKGESGVGKSSFLRMFYRNMLEYADFSIRTDTGKYFEENGAPVPSVGIVTQENTVFAGNIAENVSLFSQSVLTKEVETALQLAVFDVHKLSPSCAVKSLSTGQQQRIRIARALFDDPEILILDECTSALDKISEEKFVQLLTKKRSDKVIIAISHGAEFDQVADYIIHLSQDSVRIVKS